MDDQPGGHRGLPHPLEIPIAWWTLLSVVLLVGSVVVLLSGDEVLTVITGGGLLTLSMGGFYVTSRLINKATPESSDEGS